MKIRLLTRQAHILLPFGGERAERWQMKNRLKEHDEKQFKRCFDNGSEVY